MALTEVPSEEAKCTPDFNGSVSDMLRPGEVLVNENAEVWGTVCPCHGFPSHAIVPGEYLFICYL